VTPIVETIKELAARWAVRADAGPLRPDEQEQLDAWLAADPRHRGAYVRARAQWMDLDRLAALHGPADAVIDHSSAEGTTPENRHALSRRRLLAASMAAITLAGGGLSWMVLRGSRERYSTGVGEVRRIALADGSTLLLNTNTEVTVRLLKQRRDIQLIRGEALFEVAHDRARPFVVVANDTAVRAVGTAFAVRLESTQVDVTVTEGVVEVGNSLPPPSSGAAASMSADGRVRRVSANERMVIARARAPAIRPIAAAEAARQLAWREGMVSFDGESLQTAVAEINRHNLRQIVIDDPALAEKPIVGVFRATDLDGFSATAAEALQARVVAEGGVIRLQSRTAPTRN
jgi:transmembrane sensor